MVRLKDREYRLMKQSKRDRQKTAAILMAGFLLRLIYVLFSTIYDRQYDIGVIDLDAGHTVSGGHLAYIQYLYENWHLPDFNPTQVYQFHHPPLHHYCCAAWMKFCSLFIHNTDVLEESIQAVPFLCSLLILLVLLKILRQLSLREATVRLLMAVFAFHPALVLLSGSVNNDCMSLLFTLLCVYMAIRWSREQTYPNILALGLSIALGMLTKQNVAEMAFPVAAVFLYVFAERWRREGFPGGLLRQFAAFGLISVPLGMSFYVRNLILYDVPLVWVYTLPEDSWQYTGNVPLLNRFLWPVPAEMLDNLRQFKIGCGYNVWMQIIRTSVLGEWDMAGVGRGVKVWAVLLMASGAALAFAAFLAFWGVFVRGGCRRAGSLRRAEARDGEGLPTGAGTKGVRRDVQGGVAVDMPCRLLFVVGYLVHLLFYLAFAYRYPQQCSMHFRYIEIELLFPAAALGIWWQTTSKRWLYVGTVALVAVFCMLSAGMIAIWCMG